MACTHRKDVDLLDAISVQPGDRDAWQIVYAARIKGDAARYLREQQVQRQLLAKHCRAGKETQLVRNPNVCYRAKTLKEAHESYQQACASAEVGRQRWELWPPPAYHR
eukprot:19875-Heterococcus_DN1.PRE.2